MVYFDACHISVNNSGILADSATIRARNNIQPVYGIGRRGIFNQIPEDGIEGTVNFSYYINLLSEPIFPLTNTFKNLTGSYDGINIVIGGVTGFNCYLTSYSLKSAPNQLVKAEAAFTTYKPFSGVLRARISGENSISNFSGFLAHGWTTQILSGNSYLTVPIYDFNYNLEIDWSPVFTVANSLSNQVELMQMSESMSFVRDVFHNIQFSGEEASRESSTAFLQKNNDNEINLLPYHYIASTGVNSPSLIISLSGTRIKTSEINVQLDDFVKTAVEVSKFY